MATYFFWDEIEDNVIREYDDNNNTIAHYTTEPELYGRVISQDRGGEVRHYKYDGQGNTVALTDNSGNVTDTRKYSAFGEVTESTGTTEFPYQWGGRWGYYDSPTPHITSIRRRQYVASTARWLSVDPVLAVDVSSYGFCANRPLLLSDPSGRYPAFPPVPNDKNDEPWTPHSTEDVEDLDLLDKYRKFFLNCKCVRINKLGPPTETWPGIPFNVGGFLDCVKGKIVVRVRARWPDPEMQDCGFTDCIVRHEKVHASHFKTSIDCLGICTDRTCGWNQSPRQRWYYTLAFANQQCTNLSECLAFLASIECAVETIIKNRDDPVKGLKCEQIGQRYLQDVIDEFNKYRGDGTCKESEELRKKVIDVRRPFPFD